MMQRTMFEVFNGNDAGFTRQFQAIQNMVRLECDTELTSPEPSAQYIYWQDENSLAQGCALIRHDSITQAHVLYCIAFHMEDSILAALDENNHLYDHLIRQFYIQLYQQFCALFATYDRLAVTLPDTPVEDSLLLGHWPYHELDTAAEGDRHIGTLDISHQGLHLFRESHVHPIDQRWVH